MQKIRFRIVIISVGMFFNTCKHECPDPYAAGCNGCEYDQSIEGMKEWYYFKTGSWWVYQEQTTGELDTMTVYNDWEGISEGGYDAFRWDAIGSFDDFLYLHEFNSSFSIHCLGAPNCICHKLRRDKAIPGDYVGGGHMYTFPIIPGNYLNVIGDLTGSGTSTVTQVASTMEILGITYNAVCTWDVSIDASENDKHTRYTFAKHIGIIKREIVDDNKVWLLKEHQIVQ